jgi:hypothetical protein
LNGNLVPPPPQAEACGERTPSFTQPAGINRRLLELDLIRVLAEDPFEVLLASFKHAQQGRIELARGVEHHL